MRTESLLCPKCSMAFFSRSCRCPASVFFAVASIALARLLAAHASHIDTTPATQYPMNFNTSYFSLFSPKSCCKEIAVPFLKMTNPASKARMARRETNMKRVMSKCSRKNCRNFDESTRTRCVACLICFLKCHHNFDENACTRCAACSICFLKRCRNFEKSFFIRFMNMSGRIVGLILFGLP